MSDQFLRRDRKWREAEEAERLAPAATHAADSEGRAEPEEPDEFRTVFERDRDRILHSKAFRRLKHKTQVFLNPAGDHFVTRLTHTVQVAQVARSLAAGLGLNGDLAEAIALGHDVGHTPFGHTGEEALSPYVDGGWHHAGQSVRIFTVLEDRNLTAEVVDGIRAHSWRIDPPPSTLEGDVVRFADRIAYLTHDALDAMRAGVLAPSDFPDAARACLGTPGSDWIGRMIHAVLDESPRAGRVTMEADVLEVMRELRDFMFTRVYEAGDNERKKHSAITIIRQLVDWHLEHPDDLPETYRDTEADLTTQVLDYVAGMTDRYALAVHDDLFRPVLPVGLLLS
ncbi:MAG: HD domain-containing protein [Nitriliruptorales bacterium]